MPCISAYRLNPLILEQIAQILECVFIHCQEVGHPSQEGLWVHISRAHSPRWLLSLHIKVD
jgi:hypothetical protein